MVDIGDRLSERSSPGRISPLPPIPTLSDQIFNSQPEPGPSNSHAEQSPPNINTLHISPTPFSPNGSEIASPLTPVSLGHEQKPTKRPNPLIDLIDTEKGYVELLGGIIRVSFVYSTSSLLYPNRFICIESSLCMVKE
jgi:hypothetical protein